MKDIFQFGDIQACERTIRRTWKELREKLSFGVINGLEEAKQTTFLKKFDEAFEANNMKQYITQTLGELNNLYRGACLKTERNVSLERFLPKKEYIGVDNRFSPPGIEWLYLAYGISEDVATQCCINECRAQSGDWFGICKFEVVKADAKIADLTFGLEDSYETMNREVNEEAAKIVNEQARLFMNTGDYNYIYNVDLSFFFKKWLVPIYCKLISEQLLLPVADANKSLEYAPFQCMANYFKSIGFDGIIYKSTVYDRAKNIVLFDKYMAKPVSKREFMI